MLLWIISNFYYKIWCTHVYHQSYVYEILYHTHDPQLSSPGTLSILPNLYNWINCPSTLAYSGQFICAYLFLLGIIVTYLRPPCGSLPIPSLFITPSPNSCGLLIFPPKGDILCLTYSLPLSILCLTTFTDEIFHNLFFYLLLIDVYQKAPP